MKIKLLFLISILFFVKIGFAQNSVTYSSLNNTINVNSGVEGTVDVLVNCYGNSSTPVFLNALQSCGNNDGILSSSYTNGSILTPGQNTTIRYKFKKTVTTDTQVIYKFSTDGSCFQEESKMIKIIVNYKASNTTPSNPSTGNVIALQYHEQNPMYVGQYNRLTIFGGSYSPTDINEWQKKVGNGNWTTIPGETKWSIDLQDLSVTTSFRKYIKNSSGAYISLSNELTIKVYPILSNNTIGISGSDMQGSSPTGGTGRYVYYWYAHVLEGEDPWLIGESVSCNVPLSVYDFMDATGYITKINRVVTSSEGNAIQTSTSNTLIIPPSQEIINNVITLSGDDNVGYDIIGSIPTGGTGSFRYEYYAYNEFDGEVIGEVQKIGNERDYYQPTIGGLTIKFYRKVYSGNKVSYSNTVTILPVGSSAKMSTIENIKTSTDLTVYPNPASESVNFATNFTTNKEIEIVVYSDKLRNEKSVFKGTVTPNQVINWNIPSSYQKGLYFYKILSGNKEVKTGKIIVQ